MTDDEWARLHGRLVGFAAWRFGSGEAEDIAQEAIVRFIERAPAIAPEKIEPYLMRMVINDGINRWRRRTWSGSRQVVPLESWHGYETDFGDEIDVATEIVAVEQLLGAATVRLLADYGDEGSRRTAERLGITQGQMRVLVHHARKVARGGPTGRQSRYQARRLRRLAEGAA